MKIVQEYENTFDDQLIRVFEQNFIVKVTSNYKYCGTRLYGKITSKLYLFMKDSKMYVILCTGRIKLDE